MCVFFELWLMTLLADAGLQHEVSPPQRAAVRLTWMYRCYLACTLGSQLLGATREDKAGSLSALPARVLLYKISARSWLP